MIRIMAITQNEFSLTVFYLSVNNVFKAILDFQMLMSLKADDIASNVEPFQREHYRLNNILELLCDWDD